MTRYKLLSLKFRWLPAAMTWSLVLTAAASKQAHAETKFEARFDCVSLMGIKQRSNQACINISRLAIEWNKELEDGLRAEFRLDPFGTPHASLANLPRTEDLIIPSNQDTPLGIIDHYALRWQFRNNLVLSIEDTSGTTMLPNASGLSFGSRFQDSGWDQTAITAIYSLPPLQGVDVRLVLGNGEGENAENLDPQQFGGLEIQAMVLEGVFLKLGMSYDGNNLGSQQFEWMYNESPASLGFSTERQAIVLGLSGERQGLRGLKASIGWQRNRLTQLNQGALALPSESPFSEDSSYDVNYFLVESPDSANQITRTVVNIGVSYRVLAEYFIALDYDQRRVDTGDVAAFEICSQIVSGNCLDTQGTTNQLKQSSYTFGFGRKMFMDSLHFSLEYNATTYDNLYRFFNYLGDRDSKRKSFELVNARISYQI